MSIIKIAVTGPESSGKSDLTRALASYFSEPFAQEYARQYLGRVHGSYTMQDLETICLGQQKKVDEAITHAKNVCFFDTEMLVLKIWSQYRFGKVSPLIERAWHNQQMDLYLLCKPDIPWEPDPIRESPKQSERNLLFTMYEKELQAAGARYKIIEGVGQERVDLAAQYVKSFISPL